MSDSLSAHRIYLEAEWQAARAAPLSSRKALLVAALIDAYIDRLFEADRDHDDLLAWRTSVARDHRSLDVIMGLCGRRAGLAVVTEAVEVPLEDYAGLAVEDFMVSLYNQHSVQRVRLVMPDGSRQDMQELLAEAVAALTELG